jgi:hypothetical protein
MPLQVQPLQGQGNISGVAPAPTQTLNPTVQTDPNQQALSYVGTADNPTAQVAPLTDDVKAKMVSVLSAAQQKYPGQEAQILNQFIADNQSKYPAQMSKIQGFLGSTDGTTRTARNNNPTAMTTDVAQSLGLQEGVDYTQGDPFKSDTGQTLYTAKLIGSDPISTTVSAFDKAAANGDSIFTTASGTPRWAYYKNPPTNAQWEAFTPQQKVSTVEYLNKMENGSGGSATNTTGFKPADILTSLINDNTPPTPQPQTQDRSGGFLSRVGQDFQGIQQGMQQNMALQKAGKEGPVTGAFQTLGAGAQGLNSVIGEGLTSLFRAGVNPLIQQGLQGLGQSAAPYLSQLTQPIGNAYQSFAQAHPVGAANLNAGTQLGLLGAQFLGGGEAADAVSEQGIKSSTDAATWEQIAPKLSPTELATAAKNGGISNSGLFSSQVPTAGDQAMIDAAKPYVLSTKDPLQQIQNMQQGIADQATSLRAGLKNTGATFTKSQLQGAFNQIEDDPNLISDPVLQKKAQLLQAKALEFAGNGGGLDDLQNVNTKLDQYIAKYYPNLYNSDTLTPLRQAVSETRGSIKNLIDSRLSEGNIPNAGNYRQLLKNQSALYDAIDNVAAKVPKLGTPTGVLGSSLKWAGGAAATGLGLTAEGELLKKLGIIP